MSRSETLVGPRDLVTIMQDTKLDEQRIVEAAEWIKDAPDEAERNRRWDVVEALAGIWASRVSSRIKEILDA